MGGTRTRWAARRRAAELRRGIGDMIRGLREDGSLTQAAVAAAAGIDRSHLARIEAGSREPSLEVLAAIGSVLGADVSLRLYPTTGPRIRDRLQAPMGEALLRALHSRWTPMPEIPVFRPARGVIDFVLGDRHGAVLVATELHSELRRLEQQIRWHREKEASLPSSVAWRAPAPDRPEPATSRLLVLRSSAALIELARTYEDTLRAAYPARTPDVVAALTSATAPWPGAGIAWIRVAGSEVRLLDAPPRTVRVGR
jgi:transcriptional regulator with XRE-family HTH domain